MGHCPRKLAFGSFVKPAGQASLLGAALLLAGSAAACGTEQSGGLTSPTPSQMPTTSPTPAQTSSPFLFSDLQGNEGFYAWDGTFVARVSESRQPVVPSKEGGFYISNNTGEIWSISDDRVGVVADWSARSLKWADDGPYLCGTEKNSNGGYSLVVMGIHGDVATHPLADTGQEHNIISCSIVNGKAALREQSGLNVVSLSDGHVMSTTTLPSTWVSILVSPDASRLAATTENSARVYQTEIIDLSTSTTVSTLNDANAVSFSPDGNGLLVNDSTGAVARMVDWRTNQTLWSRPGHVVNDVVSDPTTNKVFVWISTGSTAAGTDTYDYWIVSGSGSAVVFKPQA
jgi:hypothetical protein